MTPPGADVGDTKVIAPCFREPLRSVSDRTDGDPVRAQCDPILAASQDILPEVAAQHERGGPASGVHPP